MSTAERPTSGSTSGSHGIRTPVQRRGRAVVSRILQATHDLLNEGSLDQLTMLRVAERADVSVGSIYRYYADKLDLLRAVQDRCLTDLESTVTSLLAEANPTVEDVVSALVSAFDQVVAARASEFAAFLTEAGPDPVLASRALGAIRTAFREFYAGLERDRGRIAHADLELAATIALEIVMGLFTWYARSQVPEVGDVGKPGLSRASVVREARRAAISYLLLVK